MSHDNLLDVPATESACGCGGCGCGAGDNAEAATSAAPDVDISSIPVDVREARVYGAVAALVPGEALVISAAEDPAALVAWVEAEITGDLNVVTLQSGPPVWRVAIERETCC